MISRRRFLQTGAPTGLVCLAGADPLGFPVGCQTWPWRAKLGKDFEGTLKQIASEGYRAIEMCSPQGYAQLGFGTLAGMKSAEIRDKIHAAGLRCESCHYGFNELKDHLDERLAYAQELGLKQMVIATFSLPKTAGIGDWIKAVDAANQVGEKTAKAGIQLGFHNHNFEFQQIGGKLIYDQIVPEFDAKLVKLQFQVAVVELGYQAADYFEKYPGRFLSMHLADWSPATKQQVPIGQGAVDWKRLFTAAKAAGIRNYFLEMEPDLMKASLPYVHSL